MADFDMVIDNVAVDVHSTEKNKTVFSFPTAAPDLSVTVDNGGDALAIDPERVAAGVLNMVRSTGLLPTPPSNVGSYAGGGYNADPLNQGRATNEGYSSRPTY